MHRPTARVLTALELLRARRMTGSELARRLEVDGRTVRRYVATLQDMGIPVEGERGRYGAYRLRPGYKMPPLMFTDEEALGLSLGLLAARQLGLAGVAPAVEGALAKVERVMPEALRERVRVLEQTVVLSVAPPASLPESEMVSDIAGAVGKRRRVWLRYRSARREETERVVDPHALLQRERRWHLFGWCHLRKDPRLFRLDRVLDAKVLEEAFEPPAGLDSPEAILETLVNTLGPWEIEVLLRTSVEHAREQVPRIVVSLEEEEDGVLMRRTVESLDGMARFLAGLFCPFVVRRPAELREALKQHASEITRLAELREGEKSSCGIPESSVHQEAVGRSSGSASARGLSQREEVAFAVAEEGAAFARAFARVVALDLDYPIYDFKAGYVELLENDPAGAQVCDHGVYIVDLEPELCRLAGRGSRREEEVELSGSAEVTQPTLALFDWRKI